jgi:hypothetical protein
MSDNLQAPSACYGHHPAGRGSFGIVGHDPIDKVLQAITFRMETTKYRAARAGRDTRGGYVDTLVADAG